VLSGQQFQFTFRNRVIACRGGPTRSAPDVVCQVRPDWPRWRKGKSTLGIIRDFRRAADAIERLAAGMSAAQRERAETGPLLERLVDLETSRAMWEAEVEALLMKAEGKLKAAANSEARERTMQKSREADFDPFDIPGAEVPEAIPLGYAPAGEEEGVYPVRVDVAGNNKTAALRRKFG